MELTQKQIQLLKQLNEMLIALDNALRKSLAAAYAQQQQTTNNKLQTVREYA